MTPWPQLSKPVYAGDNHRMAVAMSKQTIGKPPARPTGKSVYGGGVLGVNVVRREAANNHEARCPASTFPQRMDARPQSGNVQ